MIASNPLALGFASAWMTSAMISPEAFDRDAVSAFDFLRSRYGYRRVDTYAHQVKYEAGERYVLVSYEGRSHELTVWVGVDGDRRSSSPMSCGRPMRPRT